MATLLTHGQIGARVFPHLPRLAPEVYDSFLLGCMLVDVHVLNPADRAVTHFYYEDPIATINGQGSCQHFLARLDDLWLRPWPALTPGEQAFTAGYLCHLAADEAWKQMDRASIQTHGLRWWRDLPVPSGVTLRVFEEGVLFAPQAPAWPPGLAEAQVPHIFKHVSLSTFQTLWALVQPFVRVGGTPAAYLDLLARLGEVNPEIRAGVQAYEQQAGAAGAVIERYLGGVPARMDAMVARALAQTPKLWQHFSPS